MGLESLRQNRKQNREKNLTDKKGKKAKGNVMLFVDHF